MQWVPKQISPKQHSCSGYLNRYHPNSIYVVGTWTGITQTAFMQWVPKQISPKQHSCSGYLNRSPKQHSHSGYLNRYHPNSTHGVGTSALTQWVPKQISPTQHSQWVPKQHSCNGYIATITQTTLMHWKMTQDKDSDWLHSHTHFCLPLFSTNKPVSYTHLTLPTSVAV